MRDITYMAVRALH